MRYDTATLNPLGDRRGQSCDGCRTTLVVVVRASPSVQRDEDGWSIEGRLGFGFGLGVPLLAFALRMGYISLSDDSDPHNAGTPEWSGPGRRSLRMFYSGEV